MLAAMNDPLHDSIARWLERSEPWCITGRRSLVATYPVLAAALAPGSEIPTMMAIAAALDRGEDPASVIPGLLGVGEAAVRALAGIDPEIVGEVWCRRPIELLRAMDIVDPTARPRTGNNWRVLWDYWIGSDLGGRGDYRGPVRPGERHPAHEHLFRGLCSCGYGPSAKALGSELILTGARTAYIPTFSDYVRFLDDWLIEVVYEGPSLGKPDYDRFVAARPSMPGPRRHEAFLMRYLAEEIVAQWGRWYRLGGVKLMIDADAADCAHLLRNVLTDFEYAMRWIRHYPV